MSLLFNRNKLNEIATYPPIVRKFGKTSRPNSHPYVCAIIGSARKTFMQYTGDKNCIHIIGPNYPTKVAMNPLRNIVENACFGFIHPNNPCLVFPSSLAPSKITAIAHVVTITRKLSNKKYLILFDLISILLNIKNRAVIRLLNIRIISIAIVLYLKWCPFFS